MTKVNSTPRKQLTSEPVQMPLWAAVCKLLLVALFALVLLNYATGTFVITAVHGESMLPTYNPGQLLLMYSHKSPASYECGDIVVCEITSTNADNSMSTMKVIKRVIGVGGDVITYDNTTNTLYINSNPLDEYYLSDNYSVNGFEWTLGEYTVPEDSLFVMGDNRDKSMDSRDFGAIPFDNICGYIL